ncbi:21556_t:CDS:1, partial [Rhizophagus irregularis]
NFQKVKAHSGIHFNQLADELAKQGLDIPPISTNPKFLPDAHMGLVRPH